MCRTAPSDFGASTSPAAPASPPSIALASARVSSKLRPRASSFRLIASRSSSAKLPVCNNPSTNSRNPRSVGSRPALVCGLNNSPASVRSAITLRIVAGDNAIGSRRDRVRLPTGSPVATYCSTISRSTVAARGSRPGGIPARGGAGRSKPSMRLQGV